MEIEENNKVQGETRAKVCAYSSSHLGQENCMNERRGRTYVFKKKRNKEKSAFTFMHLIQYSDKLSQNYGVGGESFKLFKAFPKNENKVA